MGVLESVLEYKKQREAEANADINAIPTAVNTFIAAKQASQKSMIDQLTMNLQQQQFGLNAEKQPYEIAKLQAEANKAQSESGLLKSFLNGSSEGGVVASEATVGGVKFIKPDIQRQQEQFKNEMAIDLEAQKKMIAGAGAESGRVALAQESIKNIAYIKKILFPDGTANSFDRKTAFGSNIPGVDLPLLGRVTPRAIPFSEKGQQVARKMGASLAARQLIQTGVAARPEETANLFNQFAPGLYSNPQAALDGLNELEKFYASYIEKVDPTGAKGTGNKSEKESFVVPEGLKLPPGHKIIAKRKSNG